MDNPLINKQTILVVDDQPTNIDVLFGVLKSDYRVKVALDGKQALALAASEPPPDLILLDIMMPGMDGYEVCRRLKANPFTRNIPLIFVTAMAEVGDESKGFELGAVDYITKPVSPPLVKARVRTHLAVYEQNRSLEEMVRQRTLELQRANQQLIQERARFEWIVQSADDGYLTLDKSGYLTFANPQARLLLNIPADAPLASLRFDEVARRQYRPETREAWETPLTQVGAPPRYLVRPETTTAKDFWLQVDILEMDLRGGDAKDKNVIVRLSDVTQEVGSRRDRGAFTLMIHHKMRTPLGTLISGLDMLTNHAPQMPLDEIVEMAGYSLKGARRLQTVIEDILAYLDAPAQVQSGDRFPLAELASLLNDIGRSLGLTNITLDCPPTLSAASLFFSHRAMELVLWELLENSHKFHPRRSPALLIRLTPQERMIRFQVCDDGLTLSPEHLAHLWTPFYQGEKYFTGELPGMGLGLALVSTLVLSMGGSYQAYNRPDGPGLIIELLLPLAD